MHHFYVFSNSPGEVFSWVKPLCERLNKEFSVVDIHVFLTPCQYSTGEERRVLESFKGVSHVYSPKETMAKTFLKAPFPAGIVFFMGGDSMHAKRFSSHTNSQLVGYFESEVVDDRFDYIFSRSHDMDLMAVGIKALALDERKGLVLLPGSRPEHLLVALPMMIDMVDGIDSVVVMLSPFTSDAAMHQFKVTYPTVDILRMRHVNDLSRFKYALTIPGTNTMQLAYFKIPYLMILPTHDSRVLRLDGVLGLLLYLPIIGRILKFLFLNTMVRKDRCYSLPNRRFGTHVCPELIGRFTMDTAQSVLHDFMNDEPRYDAIISTFKSFDSVIDPLDDLMDWIKKIS